MRINNPEAALSFIYSSSCLTKEAIQELNNFCKRYNITPVEFENIEENLENEHDKKMYELAKEEIFRAFENTGGNLAAASDCTRLIIPVIEQYGIYSDFDVESNLTKLGAEIVSLRGPVLFPAEMVEFRTLRLSCNSDFLAFSISNQDFSCISKDAISMIRNLQSIIIKNYQQPFAWDKISLGKDIKEMNKYPELNGILEKFLRNYPDNPTIFDFRVFLSTLPDTEEKKGKLSAKNFLMHLSVINFSGPGIYPYLFQHLIPTGVTVIPLEVPHTDPKWLPYLKLYERCELGFYEPINELVQNKNSVSNALTLLNKQAVICDKSWTEDGARSQIVRDKQLVDSSNVIKNAWKDHRTFWKNNQVDRSLFIEMKKYCQEEWLVLPLREKKYSLALRRACSKLNLPVIKLLLHYKQQRNLNIEVNESSETTNNTALDWALNTAPKSTIAKKDKAEIIQLLKEADAKTYDEVHSKSTLLGK